MKIIFNFVVLAAVLATVSSEADRELTLCDGATRELFCYEKHIHILRAEWGSWQTSNECGSSSVVNCRANAKDTVKHLCHAKQDCTLEANTQIFQDPCPDSRKYLHVLYTCV